MEETDHLRLPYLIAAQAQKHVTHNEALRGLDAVVHLAVEDRNLSAPPANPADGARYLVATTATGDWTGHDAEIAAFQDGAWMFYQPKEGWIAWVSDEDIALAFDGTSWVALSSGGSGSVNPTPLVGVNATADTTNRLSVSAPSVLLNHEGSGHQLKINKAASGDTGSLLYQTGFSGRAELGLTGDDDFHFKVSPDGTNWAEAILIDKDTGAVTFPNSSIGGGSGGSAFTKLARSYANVATTINNSTWTPINFQVSEYDTDSWWSAANPERMTIPSGVTKVLCWSYVQLDPASPVGSSTFIAVTRYNSAGVLQNEVFNQWYNSFGLAISPGPIDCVAGDFFRIRVFQNSGIAKDTYVTDSRCHFAIAAVEES